VSTDGQPSTPFLVRDAAPPREPLAAPARRSLRAVGARRTGAMPLGSAPLPAEWPIEGADARADGELACAVANRIVGLLREHAGRGPTKAKCAITRDVAVVTLGDCLTTLETRLAAGGNVELVRLVRRELHAGLHPEATAIVEELTQRQVVAYLTAQEHEPDLAVLIFYLAGPQPPAS